MQPDESFDSSYESLLRISAALGDVKPRNTAILQAKLDSLSKFLYCDWPFIPRKVTHRTGQASTSAVMLDDEDTSPRAAKKGTEKEERCSVCLSVSPVPLLLPQRDKLTDIWLETRNMKRGILA